MTNADHTLPLVAATAAGQPSEARDASTGAQLAHVRGLTAALGGRPVLGDVDLDVHAGEIVVILGRSGSGKTTLLHALAGLGGSDPSRSTPAAGSADRPAGPNRSAPALDCVPAALMPQRDGLMDWASTADNAALALRIAGVSRRAARAQATQLLGQLGLSGLERRPAGLLSGGERQRVALARTLLTGRSLLLLDEPLAAVDALTRDELHGLLLDHLRSQGRGAVLVTHDLTEAARLASRLLVLGGSPAQLRAITKLTGTPGEHLEARGGSELRAEVMQALAR